MTKYFVLRVEGRKAKQVADELEGYVPIARRITKPARKHKPVVSHKPLFPGWVFLSMEYYHHWENTPHVYGPLKYGRLGVLELTEDDMQRIKEIELDSFKWPHDRVPLGQPVVGMRVSVTMGTQSIEAVIVEVLTEGRVSVDIGGNYPLTVDHCLLQPSGLYQ